MQTQVKFGTRRNAYEICIRPLKERQDYEDVNVSVRSLVNVFENDITPTSPTNRKKLAGTFDRTVRFSLPNLTACEKTDSEETLHQSLPDLLSDVQKEVPQIYLNSDDVSVFESDCLGNVGSNDAGYHSNNEYEAPTAPITPPVDDASLFHDLRDMFDKPIRQSHYVGKKHKCSRHIDGSDAHDWGRIKLDRNHGRDRADLLFSDSQNIPGHGDQQGNITLDCDTEYSAHSNTGGIEYTPLLCPNEQHFENHIPHYQNNSLNSPEGATKYDSYSHDNKAAVVNIVLVESPQHKWNIAVEDGFQGDSDLNQTVDKSNMIEQQIHFKPLKVTFSLNQICAAWCWCNLFLLVTYYNVQVSEKKIFSKKC